jgi:hypothetical protein
MLGNAGAGKPYSINTPLTTSNFKIRANPAFQKTPINTMDVYVFYLQSTFNFPSWTSRVRSPSPALNFQLIGRNVQKFVATAPAQAFGQCPVSSQQRRLRQPHLFGSGVSLTQASSARIFSMCEKRSYRSSTHMIRLAGEGSPAREENRDFSRAIAIANRCCKCPIASHDRRWRIGDLFTASHYYFERSSSREAFVSASGLL